jgi:hypothetical protein
MRKASLLQGRSSSRIAVIRGTPLVERLSMEKWVNVRFPESWCPTSLAKQAALAAAEDDSALTTPSLLSRVPGYCVLALGERWICESASCRFFFASA